jgi:ATP-dependent DNA helicase RecQ
MTDKLLPIAEKILKESIDDQASFREGQWEAISSVVNQRQQLIVVQRTGWGKSLVYFIATRLNRLQNYGLTILISPLLSLMRNQIQQAEKFGLRATRIDSTNSHDHANIEQSILNNEIDLLLISPERLANEKFRDNVWSHIHDKIGLLVVDEVHCISDWGHDFRPDYRRVMSILSELSPNTSVLGTTATANTRVIEDVRSILGDNVEISRGSLMRESLQLYTYPEPRTIAYRLVLLSHLLKSIKGTGIIYCTTIRDCDTVARWLQIEGFDVEAYHSQVKNREDLENRLLNNEVQALAASVALGMGFDKPDLNFVIHFQLPGSIISYYQQIGRAGRGIDNAYIILMHGKEDRDIQEYFINNSFPSIDTILQVAHQFDNDRIFSKRVLENEFNLKRSSADKIIQQLEIEGFIAKTPEGYRKTGRPIPDFVRWEEVTEKRYHELEQMEAFISSQDCLMQFLAGALEDPTYPQQCGRCKSCRSSQSNFVLNQHDYERVQRFLLEGDPIVIDPRKQWAGRNIITPRAKLNHINERGLALSFYNDEGWGKRVKNGKYKDNYFDDDLIAASVNLIESHWSGQIQWVTNIPSTRHPVLVPNFAKSLAKALHLPYVDAIQCYNPYPEQKTRKNSRLKLQNISDAFRIQSGIPYSSVLLVDDMIVSGWSLTLAGWLLREQGVSHVFPFILAKVMGNL